MLADHSYHTRVETGKKQEKIIVEFLRANGMTILDPSDEEDMYDKIDGWVVENNSRKSLQIKFRESGDDILFEIIKDIDKKIKGRDILSKSDYYLVVDRKGNLRLYNTAPIKNYAVQMAAAILSYLNTQRTDWRGRGWNLKIVNDRFHGNRKLIAYFSPSLFETIHSWKMTLQ